MRTRYRTAAIVLASLLSACSAADLTRPATRHAVASDVSASAASGHAVVITESDISRQLEDSPPLRNWVLYSRAAGTGAFRTGPATPPLGVGSLELTTPTGADKVTLFNYDEVGTRLADVSSMSYATYRSAGAAQQDAALNMEVNPRSTNPADPTYTTLVFEPVYNTDQGTVVSGAWQSWNAYNGVWWSTKSIPGVCAFTCYVTWNQIVAANPNAAISGGYGINQGSGNPGLVTAVDALHFDTSARSVTWDFEPYRTPSSKDDCKNGGWQTVKRADGTSFKNQGDCVSFTNH